MFGVLLLANPTLIFPFLKESRGRSFDVNKYPHFYLGVFVALCGSVSSGFAYLTMRRMGTHIHALHGPLYFGVFNIIACYILAIAVGDEMKAPFSSYGLFLISVVGIFGWLAQEGVSTAM
jgi:hypothetical protein